MKKIPSITVGRLLGSLLAGIALLSVSCVSTGGGQLSGVGYDDQERKIMNEARIVGAAAGAIAGAVIANQTDNSAWAGAAIGGVLGGVGGDLVGRGQANKARDKRMDNNSLRSALAAARSNNDKLAAYNRQVAARIASIRNAPKSEQAVLANAEIKSIDSAIQETKQLNSSRQQFVSKIPASQASEASAMKVEIQRGQNELTELTSYRSELSRIGSVASN